MSQMYLFESVIIFIGVELLLTNKILDWKMKKEYIYKSFDHFSPSLVISIS